MMATELIERLTGLVKEQADIIKAQADAPPGKEEKRGRRNHKGRTRGVP